MGGAGAAVAGVADDVIGGGGGGDGGLDCGKAVVCMYVHKGRTDSLLVFIVSMEFRGPRDSVRHKTSKKESTEAKANPNPPKAKS